MEVLETVGAANAVTGQVIICIDGRDIIRPFTDYDLTFDSPESEVLDRVRSSVLETLGQDIRDGSSFLYKVRKATDSQNIYIIPNSTAG